MQGVERRGFFIRAIQGLSALIGGALGLPAVTYLFTPSRSGSGGIWTDAGDLAKLELRSPQEMTFRRTKVDGWKIINEKSTVWVVKLDEKQVVAYSPMCTHLGCAYRYDANIKEFVCPCHTSNFSLEGKVLTGPAPRALDRYQVKVEGTRVLIGALENEQKGA